MTTINKKGIEYSFYCCLNKKRLHICNAKNIAAADIEPLVVNCIKEKILNGELIEKTADAILQACKDDGTDDVESIKREITSTESKVKNLMRTLETGLDSDAVRERLVGHEAHIKILRERLASARPVPMLNREELIAELSRDQAALASDSHYIRQVLKNISLASLWMMMWSKLTRFQIILHIEQSPANITSAGDHKPI